MQNAEFQDGRDNHLQVSSFSLFSHKSSLASKYTHAASPTAALVSGISVARREALVFALSTALAAGSTTAISTGAGACICLYD